MPELLSDLTLSPARPALEGHAGAYGIRGAGRHMLTPSSWTVTLTHAGRDVACVTQHQSEIDVRFFHAQDEAAFLTAIATLKNRDQSPMTFDAAVMELLLTRIADVDGGVLIGRAPNGTWRAQPHVQPSAALLHAEVLRDLREEGMTELYIPGEGWRAFQVRVVSDGPVPLKDACAQAMHLLDVSGGDQVELFESQQNAMFELGALTRTVLEGDPPEVEELGHCVMVCVALLAALGTTLPATRAGRLGKRAQQALEDAVEALYPGVSATLDDLARPETDTCVHHDLLDALARLQIMMGVPSWSTAEEREAVQRELLRPLVSVLRVLQGVAGMDLGTHLRLSTPA
ncbi:hypothetical protein LAJ19_20320 (plasmid) [Deinococcus taeanensis]|uniref:hypothetical protein n=1 Tax=Deinococcus taeanensis TaxID=2737050 RepID=UPI001CDCC0BB|nr:hypothetical protein [Deinococcus taeanensis]UBV45473.1 hypothetical protein LAJ19_20320 [Deinococcus taeanensis]